LAVLLALFVVRRAEKTLSGELVAALALTSPALPIALANEVAAPIAWTNVALWGGLAVCATLSVRALIARFKPRERERAARLRIVSIGLGSSAAGATALAAAFGMVPGWLAAAIIPAALFAVGVAWRCPHPRHLKRVGFALMGVQFWVLAALLIHTR
jgi:hypothetical protein